MVQSASARSLVLHTGVIGACNSDGSEGERKKPGVAEHRQCLGVAEHGRHSCCSRAAESAKHAASSLSKNSAPGSSSDE